MPRRRMRSCRLRFSRGVERDGPPVKGVAIARTPFLPYLKVLAHRPIPATWYIGEDPIKQECLASSKTDVRHHR